MSTGVGDIVANLSVDRSEWSAGLDAAKGELGDFQEHAETHVGGASRAFNFLGKEIKEGGEALAKQNEALGGAVENLGGITQGIGEVVHGYHALHTVMDIAIVKQTILNALSGPAGWITLAVGAVAAAGAYLYFSSSTNEAAENAKKLLEEQKKLREEAGKKVDSTISHLKDEIEKAKPPLEQFNDELRASGRGAAEIAKLTDEFKRLSAEAERAKDQAAAAKDLHSEGMRQATENFTPGGKFLAEFEDKHPNASNAQRDEARAYAHFKDEEDAKKKIADINKRVTDQEQHAAEALREQVEGMLDPLHRQKELLDRIRAGAANGTLGSAEAAAAEAAIQREMQEKLQGKEIKPAEQAKALEEGSDAAWKAILDAQNGSKQQEAAQKTADNTAKIADLTQRLIDAAQHAITVDFN